MQKLENSRSKLWGITSVSGIGPEPRTTGGILGKTKVKHLMNDEKRLPRKEEVWCEPVRRIRLSRGWLG
jgi:hypothetical protein